MSAFESWGRYPKVRHLAVIPIHWRDQVPRLDRFDAPVLAYGMGRSYGDVCLNDGGILLHTRPLARFIAFDPEQGLLRCEAGVTLDEILRLIVPRGWFLPVTPGTKYITVGGAIANDVHGKNHHRAGTFGRYVTRLELLRSDGQRVICSPEENAHLFRATIGGMGLTGLILWAELRLKRIPSAYVEEELVRFESLDEFFAISEQSDQDYEYTVAWVDCLARGKRLGRGIFIRGNHAVGVPSLEPDRKPKLAVPVDFPDGVLNAFTMRLFNAFYYHRVRQNRVRRLVHYDSFFYPLDAVRNWNRVYGPRGMLQFQCVIPRGDHREVIRTLIGRIARSSRASFLGVLKEFGDVPSPGLMSFPRPGVTLSLDFPFEGVRTLLLFDDLHAIVREAGGAFYPAKDAHMSPADFVASYPEWEKFVQYVDPHFSSSFWRRVTRGLLPAEDRWPQHGSTVAGAWEPA